MKYLTICLGLLFFMSVSTRVQAQEDADAISKYFNKYLDDERFTVVYVSGKLFEMFKGMELDIEDAEADAILEVVEDLKGLRVLTTEENAGQFYEEALSVINKNNYETLLEVREGKNEKVQFLVKETDNVMRELLLLVGGETEDFVLVSFIGKINLNKIAKLQKAFENKGNSGEGSGGDH